MLETIYARCYKNGGADKECHDHGECEFLKARNSLIIRFLWSTGARLSEVTKLKVGHLEEKKPEGMFYETKRGKNRRFFLPKHDSLHKDMLDFIKKYPNP